jgi:hypothetical protein
MSLGFFIVNAWILVEILAAYDVEKVGGGVSPHVREQEVSADMPETSRDVKSESRPALGLIDEKKEEPWQTPKKRRNRKRSSGPASPSSLQASSVGKPIRAVEDAINGTKWKHASKVVD